MNPELLHLMERMCEQESSMPVSGLDSTTTESFQAYREAEQIDREDYIPQLIESIGKAKDAKMRDAAYFLMGKIARRTGNRMALGFLIQQVGKETRKRLVPSLLNRIAELDKPLGTDLQPLFAALKSNAPAIRHSAIDSLQHTNDPQVESALLDLLEHSNDSLDLIYANATLGDIGTMRAIFALTKLLESRKRDVKESARFAITRIQKRQSPENS